MKTIDISNAKVPKLLFFLVKLFLFLCFYLKSSAQKCEMAVQENFLNDFYTISSNYDMNSVFTMPNVYNHELLKRHFYVILHFFLKDILNNLFFLSQSALSTEFMFEKNRFLCLVNNSLFSDEKKFSDLLPILKKKSVNKSLNESEMESSINNSNLDDEINKLGDENHLFTANLLENLVSLIYFLNNLIIIVIFPQEPFFITDYR
jgi:hypothetical protein